MKREGIQPKITRDQHALGSQIEKRKFLAGSFGLFGVLPGFQLFRINKPKRPYFFAISISLVGEGKSFMNQKMLDILDDQMFRRGEILKICSVAKHKDKESWLYIFDSQKSWIKWDREIEKNRIVNYSKVEKTTYQFCRGHRFN